MSDLGDRAHNASVLMTGAASQLRQAAYAAGLAEHAARELGDKDAERIWQNRRMELRELASSIEQEQAHYTWQRQDTAGR
jgi:hypothetical protein